MSDETQTARILDGKALAAVVRAEVKEQAHGRIRQGAESWRDRFNGSIDMDVKLPDDI